MQLRQRHVGLPAGSGGHSRLHAPCWSTQPPRLKRAVVKAADSPSNSIEGGSDSDGENAPSSNGSTEPLKLPKRGYFAIADPNQEVYSRAGEKFDPTKRGGRYKPEFIWQTNWQEALDREEQLRKKQAEAAARPKAPSSGFLSLSRLSELDRMDVDLTDVLVRKRQEQEEAEAAAASAAASLPPSGSRPKSGSASPSSQAQRKGTTAVPQFTRKEVARLSRTNKSLSRTAVMVEIPALDEEKARKAEEERVRYEQLKLEQQIWTLGFIAAGCAMTYAAYTTDVAASYTVGALGGFAYLRLLSKSVDALGGEGVEQGASGMASQPRLLIPIILGLGYNRWNELYAEQLGVMLQLLPMLVGFFTYKLAVVARQYKDVFDGRV